MTHNLWVISYEYYFLEIFQTRPKSSTFSYSLSTIHGSSTPSWYAAPSSGNFNILLTRVFSNESRLNIDGTIMTETFFWLIRSFYGRKYILIHLARFRKKLWSTTKFRVKNLSTSRKTHSDPSWNCLTGQFDPASKYLFGTGSKWRCWTTFRWIKVTFSTW